MDKAAKSKKCMVARDGVDLKLENRLKKSMNTFNESSESEIM